HSLSTGRNVPDDPSWKGGRARGALGRRCDGTSPKAGLSPARMGTAASACERCMQRGTARTDTGVNEGGPARACQPPWHTSRGNARGETTRNGFAQDVVVIGGGGHVGLALAIALADRGATVAVYDVSAEAVAAVNEARLPFDEPGAGPVLKRAVAEGRLSAST